MTCQCSVISSVIWNVLSFYEEGRVTPPSPLIQNTVCAFACLPGIEFAKLTTGLQDIQGQDLCVISYFYV